MKKNRKPGPQTPGGKFMAFAELVGFVVVRTVQRHRREGPIAFLSVSTVIAIGMVLSSLYTTSFAVTVNGRQLGVVADRSTVDETIQEVEQEGSSLLGYEFDVSEDVDYSFGVTRRTELTDESRIEDYFYSQLDNLNEHMLQYEVLVDGEAVATVKDGDAVDEVLETVRQKYVTEDTVDATVLQDVTVEEVYAEGNLSTLSELQAIFESNRDGEITYTAQAGDSLNKIARNNDMTVDELLALNPGRDIDDMLWVGDVLNVKESNPVIAVESHEHLTYSKSIPVEIETQDDDSMYKGESKILSEGTEGEIRVDATVTRINGEETERTIDSETVVKEMVPTIKAVGTKEKPTTSSTGQFSWPIRGRISSGFGRRYIFGSYSYHEGIDIPCSYGSTIKAADGGTVTFAGYKGSLGRLVIITHDNGTKTYYGHNSALLVSAGQKVAKGQAIAKAGSTGRSTGVHCHFGVMINGSFVNPLNYL